MNAPQIDLIDKIFVEYYSVLLKEFSEEIKQNMNNHETHSLSNDEIEDEDEFI